MSGIVEIASFGKTPRVTASYTRAADATSYSAGDLIGNSTTSANVVPITWDMATVWSALDIRDRPSYSLSGRITGATCTVAAASGTVVLTNLLFDLYLFRPTTGIPFAAAGYPADNAAVTLTAAASRDLIAVIPFVNAKWRNNIGANAAAGAFLWQDAAVYGLNSRASAPFNISGLASTAIQGLLVAQGAWNPGAVAQQFDIALDIDLD